MPTRQDSSDRPAQPAWIALHPPSREGSAVAQLAAQIRAAIASQTLVAGDQLAPSRTLARSLGRSRGTVVAAVEQLCAEGLLEARTGAGTFVSPDAGESVPSQDSDSRLPRRWVAPRFEPPAPAVDVAAPGLIDFRPCRPSVASFPLQDWRRCVAWAARNQPTPDYGDPRGDWSLRDAIGSYLRRARGLQLGADQIMITNGAVHAMHLLAQVYLAVDDGQRAPSAIMEDPGYPLARQILSGTGARVVYCPVDTDGMMTERLPTNAGNVRLLYTTPSHQFPTGSRLSLGRRRALIDWATRHDVLVIEDDYDGEYRYDVAPLAPLAALGQGCVAYCGSFSKTLFPDLRMGFVAAHPAQIDALARFRVRTDYTSNAMVQRALARFIGNGMYERHIHRMRRVYGKRRGVLATALAALPQPARIRGVNSGLNALVQFGDGTTDQIAELALKARRNGALMPRLSEYQIEQTESDGLVLGFAALDEAEINRGVAALG